MHEDAAKPTKREVFQSKIGSPTKKARRLEVKRRRGRRKKSGREKEKKERSYRSGEGGSGKILSSRVY